jgi:hypothetical protein
MRAALPAPTVSEKDLPPAAHLAQPGEEAKPAPPQSASEMGPQEASQSQISVSIAPRDAAALPASKPGTARVEVDAPFVFRAGDAPPTSAPDLGAETLPMSRSTSAAPLLTMAEPPTPPPANKGVMGKVKGFFSSIFK